MMQRAVKIMPHEMPEKLILDPSYLSGVEERLKKKIEWLKIHMEGAGPTKITYKEMRGIEQPLPEPDHNTLLENLRKKIQQGRVKI